MFFFPSPVTFALTVVLPCLLASWNWSESNVGKYRWQSAKVVLFSKKCRVIVAPTSGSNDHVPPLGQRVRRYSLSGALGFFFDEGLLVLLCA
uniref:Putative secreted protein n=1 Tax=Anopheles triannulatus TaxID=58253 RepID=A0A2M4B7K0_9DIPT